MGKGLLQAGRAGGRRARVAGEGELASSRTETNKGLMPPTVWTGL